jgi:pimeloyl-ACP methyl ester carboxylesterase
MQTKEAQPMTTPTWELPHTAATSAGTVRYQRSGTGAPLVLVHGTPWSSWLWHAIVPTLAASHTVYVYDLPGYGQSEKGAGQDVSLAAQGQMLSELLDYWGLERPAVAAHDIGGAIALRTHLLHARPYSRIALIDVVTLAPWGTPFAHLVSQHADVFAQVPAFIYQGMLAAYIRSAAHQPLDDATLHALMQPWLGDAGQAAFFRQIAQFDQRYTDEIEPRYAALDVPVRILWGAHDTWIPLERGQRLQQIIPGAALRVLDGVGHLLLAEAPDTVAHDLAAFFGAAGGSPGDAAQPPDVTVTDTPPAPPRTENPWTEQRAAYARVKPDLPLSWRAHTFERSAHVAPRSGPRPTPEHGRDKQRTAGEEYVPTCRMGDCSAT